MWHYRHIPSGEVAALHRRQLAYSSGPKSIGQPDRSAPLREATARNQDSNLSARPPLPGGSDKVTRAPTEHQIGWSTPPRAPLQAHAGRSPKPRTDGSSRCVPAVFPLRPPDFRPCHHVSYPTRGDGAYAIPPSVRLELQGGVGSSSQCSARPPRAPSRAVSGRPDSRPCGGHSGRGPRRADRDRVRAHRSHPSPPLPRLRPGRGLLPSRHHGMSPADRAPSWPGTPCCVDRRRPPRTSRRSASRTSEHHGPVSGARRTPNPAAH